MLSNNPEVIAFIVILVAGGLIFGIGSFLVRRESKAQPEEERIYQTLDLSEAIAAVEKRPPPDVVVASVAAQPEATTGDIALRLDMIERLVIVGQPWCIEELERDFLTDSDERIRNAAEDAILVIKTRG